MGRAPINYVHFHPESLIHDIPGVYLHAAELAAWLRDNDCDEIAEEIERLAAELAEPAALDEEGQR